MIKYSVKWDAPGSSNVGEGEVTLNSTHLLFSNTGEHSHIKFAYALELALFDLVDEEGYVARAWGGSPLVWRERGEGLRQTNHVIYCGTRLGKS